VKLARCGLAGVILLGLSGCGISTVQDVQAHPHRNWLTSTVQLQGTVGDRVPLIDAQVYQLQDPTGTIWVLTQRKDVRSGTKILIKGQVRFQRTDLQQTSREDKALADQPLRDQFSNEKMLGEAYIEEQQSETVIK